MMDYQEDSALQMNLCLKEQELENLLFHKDFNQRTPLKECELNQKKDSEIHFQNFQYKVFKETNVNMNRGSSATTRNHVTRKEQFYNVSNIPYPQEKDMVSLRSLISMESVKRAKKQSSVYVKVIKGFNSVQFHLKELAKQRERLLETVQRGKGKTAQYTRMENTDQSHPNCCRKERNEDLSLIIQKATEAIQSSTMESNMYRGMVLLIGNNCNSFDAYSSTTSRVMLKEMDDSIDDIMSILNEYVAVHQLLGRFEDFPKHNELLAAITSLITCIRCCASYTWAMESRYGGSKVSQTPEKQQRDMNIGSV